MDDKYCGAYQRTINFIYIVWLRTAMKITLICGLRWNSRDTLGESVSHLHCFFRLMCRVSSQTGH